MTSWLDTVRSLRPLTLEQVDAQAALQSRVDRKYLMAPQEWAWVLAALSSTPSVLQIAGRRSFGYASTYYDTPTLDCYRDAARGRPHRYKVRTRHYLDTASSAVEVKMRSACSTTKARQWSDPGAAAHSHVLPAEAVEFVSGFERIGDTAHRLTGVLTTSYERVTLVIGPDARVTVDRHVVATDLEGRHVDYGDLLIVETKSARSAGVVDRALWAHGHRPARLSKYATSLAALRPELPRLPGSDCASRSRARGPRVTTRRRSTRRPRRSASRSPPARPS